MVEGTMQKYKIWESSQQDETRLHSSGKANKKKHCGKKYFILLLHFAWLSNSITAYIACN
jgi:hypothetical protein